MMRTRPLADPAITTPRAPKSRLLIPWALLVLAGVLAYLLRLNAIEPVALAHRCEALAAPAWCVWRQWLVLGFLFNVYGGLALSATVLAWLWRPGRVAMGLAWLAAALGALALQLYNYDAGALALLLGCLRLVRLQARQVPARQYRRSQGQVQSQP